MSYMECDGWNRKNDQCLHGPPEEDLKLARDLLGSLVLDRRGTIWRVDGVVISAYDCDCADMNYGTEFRVFVSTGPYGDKEYLEIDEADVTEDEISFFDGMGEVIQWKRWKQGLKEVAQ